MIEDMPDIAPPAFSWKVDVPGQVTALDMGSAELVIRGKYLVAGMFENVEARALAKEHEVAFTEWESGLTLDGHPQSCLDFMLACWAEPSTQRIFDTLGLTVVEKS